jgi:hypothetical protein
VFDYVRMKESVMESDTIEIMIRGRPELGGAAAYVTAQALRATGAQVRLASPLAAPWRSEGVLRGVRVIMVVRTDPLEPRSRTAAVTGTFGAADAAKLAGATILLLMLLGAELRLHFGPRLDTAFTLAGAWAYWRYCLRAPAAKQW